MIPSDLIKGSLKTIVLKLLKDEGPIHGYAITRRVEDLTEGKIKLTYGALYPILHKLEKEGSLVTASENFNNRIRIYYALTPKGHTVVADKIKELNEFIESLQRIVEKTRNEPCLSLVFIILIRSAEISAGKKYHFLTCSKILSIMSAAMSNMKCKEEWTSTEAYKKVKKKMGAGRLKEIQQETLYSVDTNYRNMKKLVKISGVAGTVMFGFAALFKIEHWPGAGQMMSLGALFLAFIFLPSALSVLWKETHNRKRLFLFISAFFAGMLFILGTLFKIQHWPMAGTLLTLAAFSGILFFIPALALSRLSDQENKAKRPVYILGAVGTVLFVAGLLFKIQHWPLATVFILSGIFLLCFLAIPRFTWLTWKEESNVSPKFIFMVIGFLLIVIPGAMLTLSMQQSYQDNYYPNNDQQKALYDYLFRNNNSLISSYKDSSNYHEMEKLHLKTAEILATISNIEKKMVQESAGQPGKPAVSALTDKSDRNWSGNRLLGKFGGH